MVEEDDKNERSVAPWAAGENLRVIEKDVLIPNLMKKKAKVLCKEYMDSFADCVKGRTISMAWSCRKETSAMKKCLREQLENPDLYKESRDEYLRGRQQFQNNYVETGQTKKMERKDRSF